MIPKIVHQLWKTGEIPPQYRYWQSSWKRLNPHFEYQLWTNADLEQLIAKEMPEWESIFWSYSNNICRTDLARYLILQRYGGIYADMDFECLAPLDALLANHSMVIGLEPENHSRYEKTVKSKIDAIACNAFIASTPNHPFWDHLLRDLKFASADPDPLDSTGPFLLTRSLSTYKRADATLVPASLLFPFTKEDCWNGKIDNLVFFEKTSQAAFGIHYWEGSWFNRPRHSSPELRTYPKSIESYLSEIHALTTPPYESTREIKSAHLNQNRSKFPIVSCLMVTRGKVDLLRGSIECFKRQTYPNKELVIVSDETAQKLAFLMDEYADQPIQWILGADSKLTLGELRNVSLDYAKGQWVCQWDDDDLYDPSRITFQMGVIQTMNADACFLQRWLIWWPAKQRLGVSGKRFWEGSMLINKDRISRYPTLQRGEDTPVMEAILSTCRVATLDLPRLYIYRVHGANTFEESHFEAIYQAADLRYEGERYRRVEQELNKRIPMEIAFNISNFNARFSIIS